MLEASENSNPNRTSKYKGRSDIRAAGDGPPTWPVCASSKGPVARHLFPAPVGQRYHWYHLWHARNVPWGQRHLKNPQNVGTSSVTQVGGWVPLFALNSAESFSYQQSSPNSASTPCIEGTINQSLIPACGLQLQKPREKPIAVIAVHVYWHYSSRYTYWQIFFFWLLWGGPVRG